VGIFGKPTLAQIYVKELRTRLDGTLVPLFAPDVDVEIGALGTFDKGQFVPSGATLSDEFGIVIPTREDASPSDWVFASEGAIDLVQEGTVSVGGVDLLKGRLSFQRDRAVVASFKGVTETSAIWTSDLNRRIWNLYLKTRLEPTTVVIRTVRRAISGTVLVSRKGGISVELAADPELLGGLLSLQGLGAGVTFTGGTQAAVQLSGTGMTPFVRARGVDESDQRELVDVKGFEEDAAVMDEVEVPDVTVETILGSADWAEPETD
jgi:hypothetical protein